MMDLDLKLYLTNFWALVRDLVGELLMIDGLYLLVKMMIIYYQSE